jgi:hypothetical protein
VESQLPIINENCPACFEQPKERARVKKMLSKEESLFPKMYHNLRRGLVPLMDDAIYDIMKVRVCGGGGCVEITCMCVLLSLPACLPA